MKTAVRAITFPVVSVEDGDWKSLRDALGDMWALTTQASNWMMREYYTRDVRRDGQSKMPAMPKVVLYQEARRLFPGLPSNTVASLEWATKGKYRKLRYDIIWRCAVSLPTFRYPTPFAIPNQAWACEFDEGGRPVISARIADRRWTLRLKGGPRFARQLAAFRQFTKGEAKRGEAALYKSHDGEIMCKMVGHFPVQEREVSGRLTLKTAADTLLIAYNESGEKVRFWNWPHLERWVWENKTRVSMFAEDSKAEQRARGKEPSFQHCRDMVASKFKRRTDSAVKELAAQSVGLAMRWKMAQVVYDDQERHARLRELQNDGKTYRELFQWFALKQRIEILCVEQGIEFIYRGSDAK